MEKMVSDMEASSEGRAANIGPRERRKRVVLGLVMLAVSVGIAAALMRSGASPFWRLGLFVPLWMAALCFLQARGKT